MKFDEESNNGDVQLQQQEQAKDEHAHRREEEQEEDEEGLPLLPDSDTCTPQHSNTSTSITCTTRPSSSSRVRGILKMIASQSPSAIQEYEYNKQVLEETDKVFQTRKRKKQRNNGSANHHGVHHDAEGQQQQQHQSPSSLSTKGKFVSLQEVLCRHRYVCFFIIQGSCDGQYYSTHTLAIRKRLAIHYHDSISTILVSLNGGGGGGEKRSRKSRISSKSTDTVDIDCDGNNRHEVGHDAAFCRGSGFCSLPSSPIFFTLFNVVAVPSIVIVDTMTGRPISPDAGLALEWNDAHYVMNAWQRGSSGLTWCQKLLAVLTFQSGISIGI